MPPGTLSFQWHFFWGMILILGKKILVIGCGGAGKSTLSRQLQQSTGLELIHLDKMFWLPGWRSLSREEFTRLLLPRLQEEEWIMDGNYVSTLPLRLQYADTVVFLDFPTWLCVFRVMKRWVLFWGQSRPDVTEGCVEKVDWEFLRWILSYPRNCRPRMMEALQGFSGTVIHVHSPSQLKSLV